MLEDSKWPKRKVGNKGSCEGKGVGRSFAVRLMPYNCNRDEAPANIRLRLFNHSLADSE